MMAMVDGLLPTMTLSLSAAGAARAPGGPDEPRDGAARQIRAT